MGVALDQLRVNTLRTILSTLGVIIGVGSLVAVLSLGDGMEAFTRSEVERTTDVQSVTLASRTGEMVDGSWVPVRDYPVFGPADAQAILHEVEYVKDVALSVQATVPVESPRSGARRETGVTAAMAGVDVFAHVKLAVGRFFTRVEDTRSAPVVVLSHKLANELASPRAPGQLIGEIGAGERNAARGDRRARTVQGGAGITPRSFPTRRSRCCRGTPVGASCRT